MNYRMLIYNSLKKILYFDYLNGTNFRGFIFFFQKKMHFASINFRGCPV